MRCQRLSSLSAQLNGTSATSRFVQQPAASRRASFVPRQSPDRKRELVVEAATEVIATAAVAGAVAASVLGGPPGSPAAQAQATLLQRI